MSHFYVNEGSRWVVATDGNTYHTNDDGRSWRKTPISPGVTLRAVFFVDQDTGWVSGWPRGGIYFTADRGRTWRQQFRQDAENNVGINSLFFVNRNEGWAAGRRWPKQIGDEPTTGVVLHTTDGGKNWNHIQLQNGELFYTELHFSGEKHGWLVGRNGVYRTEDSGGSWRGVLDIPSAR